MAFMANGAAGVVDVSGNVTSGTAYLSGCGDKCKSKQSDPWESIPKFVMSPGGVGLVAVVAVIGLLALLLVLWRVHVNNKKAFGPFWSVVQLVIQGHNQASQLNQRDADSNYRRALLKLCRIALNKDDQGCSVNLAALEVDKLLSEYNGAAPLAARLSFALPSDVMEPGMKVLAATFAEAGLGCVVQELTVAKVSEGSAAATAGIRAGDKLITINGKEPNELPFETLQAQLSSPGCATFNRDDREESKVFVCSRCATANSVSSSISTFRCCSCQATTLTWDFVVGPCDLDATMNKTRLCSRKQQQVWPENGYPQYQGFSWESSELSSAIRHSLGIGQACDPPEDCKHHKQTGATCGVAAVNNLITNCSLPSIDAEYMLRLSKALGEAETAIREGEQAVEEAGEQQNVADLYSDSDGGHFDVQTLQIAFDEAGFHMSYVPVHKQQVPDKLLDGSSGQDDIVGFVLHLRNPLNPKRDHWFVLRRHGSKRAQYLIQDSLFEKVFDVTRVEARDLILYSPPGSVFSVSRKPSS
eukprot:TRINITY_DN72204_c0_g1_i1.p1 TRINITY_DN72204_c0_g1~~TRINITY_DN72204_c0_g1_i1.p1  ORF type:complete len:539 (-),score=91.12 TRINITY_DN72204_c0_g1_i1:220-1806(-)